MLTLQKEVKDWLMAHMSHESNVMEIQAEKMNVKTFLGRGSPQASQQGTKKRRIDEEEEEEKKLKELSLAIQPWYETGSELHIQNIPDVSQR